MNEYFCIYEWLLTPQSIWTLWRNFTKYRSSKKNECTKIKWGYRAYTEIYQRFIELIQVKTPSAVFKERQLFWLFWDSADPIDQKECNSSDASQNNLEGTPFVTSKSVISWNQRLRFCSSDINLAFRYDPDNFVCHLSLNATTRNQQCL